MRGVIGGKETTHDVNAAWVLNREYLRLHEVSREKNGKGEPAYEAIVFVSWDAKAPEYVCLWLDNTAGGGLSAQGLAHAKPADDAMPFIFRLSADNSLHTTFAYESGSDTWKWTIDDVTRGKSDRFAEVTLTRR